jgi:hypothetical protein
MYQQESLMSLLTANEWRIAEAIAGIGYAIRRLAGLWERSSRLQIEIS